MKKYNIIISLAILSMVLVIGCKKDDTLQPITSNAPISSEGLRVKSLVSDFRSKISSGFKSDEIMSVDSAVWYIETTLNCTYANASIPYDRYVYDSVKRTISANADGVSLSEVATAYDDILNGVSKTYYATNSNVLTLVDVYSQENESGELEIGARYIVGTKAQDDLPDGFYGEDWRAYGGAGMCDGTDEGRDACTELTSRYNKWHSNVPRNAVILDVELYEKKYAFCYVKWIIGGTIPCIQSEYLQRYYEAIPSIIDGFNISGRYRQALVNDDWPSTPHTIGIYLKVLFGNILVYRQDGIVDTEVIPRPNN